MCKLRRAEGPEEGLRVLPHLGVLAAGAGWPKITSVASMRHWTQTGGLYIAFSSCSPRIFLASVSATTASTDRRHSPSFFRAELGSGDRGWRCSCRQPSEGQR